MPADLHCLVYRRQLSGLSFGLHFLFSYSFFKNCFFRCSCEAEDRRDHDFGSHLSGTDHDRCAGDPPINRKCANLTNGAVNRRGIDLHSISV